MSKEKQDEMFYDAMSELINCYKRRNRILKELVQIERCLSHRIHFDQAKSLNKGKLIVLNYNYQYKYCICIPYDYPFKQVTMKILKPNIDQMKSHPNLNSETGSICIPSYEISPSTSILATISSIDALNLQLATSSQKIQDDNKEKIRYFECFEVHKNELLQRHTNQLCRDKQLVTGYCSYDSQKIDIPFIIKNIILCFYSKYGRFAMKKDFLYIQ